MKTSIYELYENFYIEGHSIHKGVNEMFLVLSALYMCFDWNSVYRMSTEVCWVFVSFSIQDVHRGLLSVCEFVECLWVSWRLSLWKPHLHRRCKCFCYCTVWNGCLLWVKLCVRGRNIMLLSLCDGMKTGGGSGTPTLLAPNRHDTHAIYQMFFLIVGLSIFVAILLVTSHDSWPHWMDHNPCTPTMLE
jgi:hypothetical protein